MIGSVSECANFTSARTHLLLLSLIGQDGSTVDDETVGRHTVVKLEALLSRGNRGKDREPVDTRLDVGRRSVLLREHTRHGGDLASAFIQSDDCRMMPVAVFSDSRERTDRGGMTSEICTSMTL